MDLPVELRSPRKGLINIKNKDEKCFLWCHVRHTNPSKEHPERIKKLTKKLLKNVIMMELSFPCKKKILTIFNDWGYKDKLVFPVYVSEQKFEDNMDLLLLIYDDKSHYVYIKDFNRFIFHKTKNKNKKRFCGSCLQWKCVDKT